MPRVVESARRVATVAVEGSAEELEFPPCSAPAPLLSWSVGLGCLREGRLRQTLQHGPLIP